MRKMLQKISEALPLREEVMHDVPNLDPEDPCINVDHLKLENSSQKEFGTKYHRDKLNMAKAISNLIDIELDITVDVATNLKVEVTTNIELKPILNESVDEPIHFLAIVGKVPAKEVDEFNSFSFDKDNKARVTKTSRDM
ncbi:hypothetical protein PVK06_021092 [Gossypium arboreum]|uniref:Uncharacterized protein n=1 Tax=Gossypium arboreum TaxID=29729 RepID=A0ABR0PP29_GOSAR|nr:hypothetical protein PVK06_021092 [Gossypium arboreum]